MNAIKRNAHAREISCKQEAELQQAIDTLCKAYSKACNAIHSCPRETRCGEEYVEYEFLAEIQRYTDEWSLGVSVKVYAYTPYTETENDDEGGIIRHTIYDITELDFFMPEYWKEYASLKDALDDLTPRLAALCDDVIDQIYEYYYQ